MRASHVPEPPYFDRKKSSSVTQFSGIGTRPDRPFMILATFAETALGDLISKITFVSSLKDQFDHARLIVRYSDIRPYSRDVISLSPNIDHAEAIGGHRPAWVRRFWPDMRLWRPLSGVIKPTNRFHESFFDMVVVDAMANARTVHAFDPPTPLRVPPDQCDALARQLVDLGLDPAKSFAVVHYRDGTYAYKGKNPVRNGDPESYRQAIDHTIDTLGCQVLQIGHAAMKPFPARPGLIDITRVEAPFMLQAFAVSRARFMIGGASGPVALGWGFGVPTAVCDCAEAHSTWGSEHNVYLSHEVTTPDGETLQNQSLLDAGLLDVRALTRRVKAGENYTLRKNSAAEISAVASYLHECSADVTGWRGEPPPMIRTRPNTLTWPPQTTWNVKFLNP